LAALPVSLDAPFLIAGAATGNETEVDGDLRGVSTRPPTHRQGAASIREKSATKPARWQDSNMLEPDGVPLTRQRSASTAEHEHVGANRRSGEDSLLRSMTAILAQVSEEREAKELLIACPCKSMQRRHGSPSATRC